MYMYKTMHKYYDDCFTNGVFDREKILKKKLIDDGYDTDYRLSLLEKVYKIILDAKFQHELSIMYLTTSNRTFDDVVRAYNIDNNLDIKLNTGRSRIIYCSRKINDIFTELEYEGNKLCFIEWLFCKKAHMGLSLSSEKIDLRNNFIRQINKFNDIYSEIPKIGKKDIAIALPSCEKVKELSDEEYDNFMDIIRPYSKHYMSMIQSEIFKMTREVGYIKYLMSDRSSLSDVDIERKNDLLRWLGKSELDKEELVDTSEYINEALDTNNSLLDIDYDNFIYTSEEIEYAEDEDDGEEFNPFLALDNE